MYITSCPSKESVLISLISSARSDVGSFATVMIKGGRHTSQRLMLTYLELT